MIKTWKVPLLLLVAVSVLLLATKAAPQRTLMDLREEVTVHEVRLDIVERAILDIRNGGTALSHSQATDVAVLKSQVAALNEQFRALIAGLIANLLAIIGFAARYYVDRSKKV